MCCAGGTTRLAALLGRLRSLAQGAAPSAAAATAAVAGAQQSSVLGPALSGVTTIVAIAAGVPRLMRWRYPIARIDAEVRGRCWAAVVLARI